MSTTRSLPTATAAVMQLYRRECDRLGYRPDPSQKRIVARLDELRVRLLASGRPGLLRRLLARGARHELQRGLYLWGGVGRGKTWLMDLFFQSLPFKEKQRTHFHRFMQYVHGELRRHRERADPLELVAEKTARHARVLCLDELFVTDIADAMLLGGLFRGLIDRGVTLVTTSNVAPDDLYRDGLQRARFEPAIALLKEHLDVVQLEAGVDYRLRVLERATTWFEAREPGTHAALQALFTAIAGSPGVANTTIVLNQRRLRAQRQADDAIWFAFGQLCEGPRGQADYIELARCYHTVFLTDVPVLGTEAENQARRFITLVDEFYDRAVKLIVSAAAPVQELYRGTRLAFDFERTKSRLTEMQSQEYLARPHQP